MTAAATPAFTVTLTATQTTLFNIDAAAFERWCAAKGEDLECEIPIWTMSDAGAALSEMFYDARKAGVIVGDAAFELNVYGDDDVEVSGFYCVLKNVSGSQRLIGLTSGWTEVLRITDATDAPECAREHLEEICRVANDVLRAVGANPGGTGLTHRHSNRA
ncbi:hypothetical protein F0Q45_10270 [Mycobacterium simiae]|uniref:Uncharacterized protein n=1 Tax=Mycobacterium simiae TaxID=1784 RepID=A0A5B1BRB7_MYCSI|nr:hypothetical protein [Mycobacterium simiae]KAA1250315.1 hypothetical protein F0Q45_10270 [Mycobacterium simiae]